MTESKLNLMWEMYGKGDSLRTIANALGLSIGTLLEHLGNHREEDM